MEKDFVIEDDILLEYTGTDKIVQIPENVKIIGVECFLNNYYIEKIILPKNLKEINSDAFNNCKNLKEINLENVNYIRYDAFKCCKSLTEINLLNIIEVRDGAFRKCDNLKKANIKIKGKTQDIGCIFSYCNNLTNINVENASITSINKIIGVHNPSLTKVTGSNIICEDGVIYNKDKTTLIGYLEGKKDKYFKIPDTVEIICETAILNNDYLKTLEFGKNIKIVEDCAISCNLENIIVNNKLEELKTASISDDCKIKVLDLRKTQLKEFNGKSVDCENCKIFLPIDIKFITMENDYANKIIINKKCKAEIIGLRRKIEYEQTLEELIEEGKTFIEASRIIKERER